jgi:hypothetical protein
MQPCDNNSKQSIFRAFRFVDCHSIRICVDGSKKCLIERSLSPSSPIFFKPDKVGIVRYYDFLKTDVLRSASDRTSSKLKLDKLRRNMVQRPNIYNIFGVGRLINIKMYHGGSLRRSYVLLALLSHL